MCRRSGICLRSFVLELHSTATLEYLRSSGYVELPVIFTLQVNLSELVTLTRMLDMAHISSRRVADVASTATIRRSDVSHENLPR